MTTKHTPGPFYSRGLEIRMADNGSGNDHLIATVAPDSDYSEGDARLFAAAPDLLVAAVNATIRMRVMRERLRDAGLFCSCADEIDDLDAAIAKARGEG